MPPNLQLNPGQPQPDAMPPQPAAVPTQPAATQPQPAGAAPPHVYLTIDPTTLPADHHTTAQVSALVLDNDGHAVIGAPVSFSTTLGTIPRDAVTTGQDGRAAVLLTAAEHPGLATVSAQTEGTLAASQVSFTTTGANTPTLEIHGWGGQLSCFVAEKWLAAPTAVGSRCQRQHLTDIADPR